MKFQYTIDDAYASLCPTVSFHILDGSIQYWSDPSVPVPTKQELEDEVERLQADYDSKEYQRQRAKEYPLITDQLDMLWHAINNGTLDKSSEFYTAIKAVKDASPKT
jgi:4-hydroxyphenylpyruvate dioxygenase-like putative hemolysin